MIAKLRSVFHSGVETHWINFPQHLEIAKTKSEIFLKTQHLTLSVVVLFLSLAVGQFLQRLGVDL